MIASVSDLDSGFSSSKLLEVTKQTFLKFLFFWKIALNCWGPGQISDQKLSWNEANISINLGSPERRSVLTQRQNECPHLAMTRLARTWPDEQSLNFHVMFEKKKKATRKNTTFYIWQLFLHWSISIWVIPKTCPLGKHRVVSVSKMLFSMKYTSNQLSGSQ